MINIAYQQKSHRNYTCLLISNSTQPHKDDYLGVGHSFLAMLMGWLSALAQGVFAGLTAWSARRRATADPAPILSDH